MSADAATARVFKRWLEAEHPGTVWDVEIEAADDDERSFAGGSAMAEPRNVAAGEVGGTPQDRGSNS